MRVVVTPPVAEPVLLEEAKAHLRVDGDEEDALIGSLIVAAREYAESYVDRALVTQTRKLVLDCFAPRIRLEPFQSIVAVRYLDADRAVQVVAASDYHANDVGGVVQMLSAWPAVANVSGAIEIEYVAGFDDVPQQLKHAILLLVGHWFENREAASRNVPQAVSFGVDRLLQGFRLYL